MPRLCILLPALAAALPFAALALAACGSSGEPTSSSSDGAPAFPATPLVTLTGDAGALVVELRSIPQPPTRGANTMELTVHDVATGAPAVGLTISAVPWMPAMGHGASVVPGVTETSPGTYVVSNVEFFMPGTWLLKTDFSGAVSDHVEPSFQIP